MYVFTVEIADPPPGWSEEVVDVRHRNIPADRIGHACSALLKLSYEFWLRAGRPGKAAPAVVVSRLNLSSFSS